MIREYKLNKQFKDISNSIKEMKHTLMWSAPIFTISTMNSIMEKLGVNKDTRDEVIHEMELVYKDWVSQGKNDLPKCPECNEIMTPIIEDNGTKENPQNELSYFKCGKCGFEFNN